jgi:hypothetical protein
LGLVGCAVGSEAEIEALEDQLGTQAADDDAGGNATIALPPPSTTEDPPLPADEAGTPDGGLPEAGPADGGAGDGGAGDGGAPASCAATTTCAAATDLGTIRGDKGSDVKTVSGSGSQWFKIRVNEDDSSIDGNSEEMKAVLTAPAGTNYDLYLYLPGSGPTTRNCTTVSKSSVSTGSSDTAGLEWGESSLFSNGDSDDRTVTVEVRHVSGSCTPTAKWTLSVYGNTH